MEIKPELPGKKFKLPKEVAVFPLPNVILFPRVEIPLYIFEPRYRQMLKDIMAGNKCLAISLLRRGWQSAEEPQPSHQVVGVGFIKAVIDHPDGTFHILVHGVERAKILNYLKMEPYRIAKIRPLPEKIENTTELGKLARTLRELFEKKLRMASEKPYRQFPLPKDLKDPLTLSHFVSLTAAIDPYLKQDLLETVNANCRMKHLISILRDEILPPGTQN